MHIQKLKIFFLLIRNLQKICKIPKPLVLKKLKTQTQTETFGFHWVHMSDSLIFLAQFQH